MRKLSRSEAVYELEHMFGAPELPGYVIRVLDDGALIDHSREPNLAVNADSGGERVACDVSPLDIRDVEAALLNDRFALVAIADVGFGDEFIHD